MSDKENKEEKRERDLNWMENFKIEGRYLKLCNEFQAVVRRMKLLFTDESIKNSRYVRWSKDSAEHLFQIMWPSLWKASLSFWNTRLSLWGFKRKLKSRSRVWKARSSVSKAWQRVSVITWPMPSHSTTVININLNQVKRHEEKSRDQSKF